MKVHQKDKKTFENGARKAFRTVTLDQALASAPLPVQVMQRLLPGSLSRPRMIFSCFAFCALLVIFVF